MNRKRSFDQEDIYKLILNENWTDILNTLHLHKTEISTDSLLQHSAKIFEQEFLNKVGQYPLDKIDIIENLETLYLLNQGNFYILQPENFKNLIVELVRRKSLNEAVEYARFFPEEENCKKIITEFEKLKIKEDGFQLLVPNSIPMNWIEIYNRLFEIINTNNPAVYFSGSKFINVVKEFEPYFPDYTQFIDDRNRKGKSTSRKIYYYDILLGLEEEKRVKVIDRMLEMLKPFEKDKVERIEELLGKNQITQNISPPTVATINETNQNPVVFISYSWDNENHKEWVLKLADRLCSDGIDVILDRYYLNAGKNLNHFIEDSIARSNRVIIIYTPNYKLKADKRSGGVGYEYSIMNIELYNKQTSNEKIIPVLRLGSSQESIPTFMQQFIHIDLRNDENFENSYTDLIREIYNEPAIQKPAIGKKPDFT